MRRLRDYRSFRFAVVSFVLSLETFALVGLNRYFDGVWAGAPPGTSIFTLSGQLVWLASILIATVTGALILGALALTLPRVVREGSGLLSEIRKIGLEHSENPTPSSQEEHTHTPPANSKDIVSLIEEVDSKFTVWRIKQLWIDGIVLGFIIALVIGMGVLIQFSPFPQNFYFIGLTTPILVFLITYTNFIFGRWHETLTNANYGRIANKRVNMILYSIISMKAKHPKIQLKAAYEENKALFDRNSLVERIYR
jgi:hypothetical protein